VERVGRLKAIRGERSADGANGGDCDERAAAIEARDLEARTEDGKAPSVLWPRRLERTKIALKKAS